MNRSKWLLPLMLALITVQFWSGTHHRFLAFSAFLGAVAAWIGVCHGTSRDDSRPYWIGSVLASGFAIGLCLAVAFPPSTSKDFNSYALYGRMAQHYDISPYTHTPAEIAGDPWFARTSLFWSDTPSVYGPVFTGMSQSVVAITGTNVTQTRLMFQLLAALGLVGATAVGATQLGWRRAIAWIGLNPLLLSFGVNDAHCDVLIGACVLAAIVALQRRRFVTAGVVFGLAAMIKITAVVAVVGAVVWLVYRGSERAWRNVAALAGSFAAVCIVSIASAGGLDVLRPLSGATGRNTRFSVWHPVHNAIVDHVPSAIATYGVADSVVSWCSLAAVGVVTSVMLWKFRNAEYPLMPVVCGLFVYQVLGAYVLSWYAAWALPSLALAPRSRLAVLVMLHASWVAAAYFSGWGIMVVTAVLLVGLVLKRSEALQWWRHESRNVRQTELAIP